jgi:hypothetical protein
MCAARRRQYKTMPELIGFAQFMLSFVREIRPQGKYDEMEGTA